MNKYEKALTQMCRQCKTKPSNCNKTKCNRYNAFKELIEGVKVISEYINIYTNNMYYDLTDNEEKLVNEVLASI